MPLQKEVKTKLITDYHRHDGDTGSPEVQIAILTGAAGRMGQAVARRLAGDGYALALVDRDEGGLQRLARDLGGKTAAIAAELSLPGTAETILARCEEAPPRGQRRRARQARRYDRTCRSSALACSAPP